MPNRDKQRFSRKQILTGSIICAVGALFYCYEFILRIIPGILQNELSAALGHLSASTFGQLTALYYVAYSPMQLPVGILMDRFGPRYLLSLASLSCTLGAFMFGSTILFIAGMGRFLIGFGSAFAFVGVLSSAIHWLPQRYFSLVAGLMTTLSMLGLVYGEIEITLINHLFGLHAVFLLTVCVGLLLTVFIVSIVRDAPDKAAQVHPSFSIFWAQILEVLKSRQIWIIGMVGACLYTSLSVFGELWGKSFLERAYHLTSLDAAKTISMLFFGWALGAPLSGYLSDRSGQRKLPLIIGALGSVVCISIILAYPNAISYPVLNGLVFLYGLFSSVEIIVFIMAKEAHPAHALSGTLFAAVNMIISLGAIIFQPLVGLLLDAFAGPLAQNPMHTYTTMHYQAALLILPIAMILVILGTYFISAPKGSRN